jgi:hypothetical protein
VTRRTLIRVELVQADETDVVALAGLQFPEPRRIPVAEGVDDQFQAGSPAMWGE